MLCYLRFLFADSSSLHSQNFELFWWKFFLSNGNRFEYFEFLFEIWIRYRRKTYKVQLEPFWFFRFFKKYLQICWVANSSDLKQICCKYSCKNWRRLDTVFKKKFSRFLQDMLKSKHEFPIQSFVLTTTTVFKKLL